MFCEFLDAYPSKQKKGDPITEAALLIRYYEPDEPERT